MKPICETRLGKLLPACAIQKIQINRGNVPTFAQPQTPGAMPGATPGEITGTDTGNLFKNPILLTVGGLAAIVILVYVLRKK